MSHEFRMPPVTGRTTQEQVRQILSFLRQMVQELNYVMRTLEEENQSKNGSS